MKPATLGLFAFLASFIIYFFIGIFLVGLIRSNGTVYSDPTTSYEIAFGVAVVASIVTGYLAWFFEEE